uniref:DNA-directed RNA polymerase subunit beta n=1 Tax=Iridovirus LCIVAC01 TaxID=2506607 RepID=A0A481YR19_9VIRU|nr:MAG: DNA-directed RNA polymerase subunit beta, possible euk contamination [Iridovirus LCIVAC01]
MVSFKESYIDKPSIIEEDRSMHPITPNEARIRDLTYEALISVDISTELWKEDGDKKELLESKYFEKVSIARLPVMVRSCKCNIDKMNSKDLIELKECSYDSGGYFIIKGKERVIVAQERINYNQIYVFPQKSTNKYAYIAEIRSTSERTGHSVLIQAKIGDDGRNICFSLPYIQQDIPAGIVFHAMGFSDIESLILPCYRNEHKDQILKIKGLIKRIVREGWHIQDRNKALEYVGQYAMHTINKERRIQYSQQILENELLPHLGISSSIHERALFLGFMIRKLITTYLGFRPADDRDNVSNKRLETVGTLVGDLFKSLFKRFIKSLQQFLVKKPDIMIAIPRFNTITYKLRNCYSTGNWGLKKSSYIRTGVSQVLSRLSYGSTLSHLRRIVIPIGKEGKNTKIRQTHPSQFGFVCPVETPEGHSAGIVKNLALLSSVTIDVPKINVQEIVEDGPGFLSLLDGYRKATTKVIMNGIWLGVCKDHNMLLNYLKDMRERKLVHNTVGISYDKIDDELFVFTDAGRLFRPLFVIKNDTIPALEQKIWDWDYLVEEGYIKYVDSLEAEQSVIAMWPQNLGKKVKYDYCEIHPSMLLGVCGSTIPFPSHSQSPRNTYQASMGKKALGIYALSHSMRVDTITHTLHYPQKPLVSTVPGDFMGFSDMPSGINAIVAIACYTGFNQEDSVIMNKSAIERGLFRTTAYRTLLIQEQKRGSHSFEAIELPPNDIRNNSHNYRKLGRDGIIEPGMPVRKGDVLVGKVISKMSKSGDEEKKECSRVATIGEEGVVEKVFLTTNMDGYKLVRIKIRSVRIPEIGDKFASRSAQKGICGMVYRQEDLPFSRDGICPDILINPHAIPSRMTINQLMECVIGKASVLKGKFADSTPFTSSSKMETIKKICEGLKEFGFEDNGYETLYSGFTGEPIKAKIFMGPTYYQRLKHLVKDKIHSRSFGNVQMLTLQPVAGRSKQGGLRFGEMERDCMISHGAASFLRERLFDMSDPYQVRVCPQCGIMVNSINKCNACDEDNIVTVELPYAMKLLFQELMAMSIKIKLIPGA